MSGELVVLWGLIINSITDIWRKQVSPVSIIIVGGIGIFLGFCGRSLLSLIPGILLLIIAAVTHEKVGYGDGLIVLFMGVFMTLWDLTTVIFLGTCFSGIVAVALLLIKKSAKEEIPFVPFLLAGYMCWEVAK